MLPPLKRVFQLIRIVISYRLTDFWTFWHTESSKVDPKTLHHLAQRTRLALIELGPLFIKFGQLLATRRDALPESFANELAKLQDRVPPFEGSQALSLLAHHLGAPLSTFFRSVEEQPLAAASIAQVHAGFLHTGEAVAIKILRPNVHQQVQKDAALLFWVAGILPFFWKGALRFKPRAIAQRMVHTLEQELDLRQEAANAALLGRSFEHSSLLKVPKVYWDLCRPSVLVTERIEGIPIYDTPALQKAGVDLKKLAEDGVEIFFTQVFRDRFFHADMHAGNLFVLHSPEGKPHYAAVDFGIMGTLTQRDQTYLAVNFLAFFQRDYERIAQCHIESGWVPKETCVADLEADFRTMLEPIFAKPLHDISFGHLLLRLIQVARRHHMQTQTQLLLLQKTLLSVEGLGRQLYPHLDLWRTAKPFLERWAKRHFGIRANLRRFKRHWPFLQEQLPAAFHYWVAHLKTAQTPSEPPPPPRRRPSFALGLGLGIAIMLVFWYTGLRV